MISEAGCQIPAGNVIANGVKQSLTL